MKLILYCCLIFISTKLTAQNIFVERIEAVKNQQNNWIKNAKPNSIPDSFGAISASKYIAVLDSIKSICKTNQKMENSSTINELWQQGAWKESTAGNRNNLLRLLSLMKDSVLFDFLQKQNTTIYEPPKQTECCAIPDGYATNIEVFAKMHPYIIAMLSTSNYYVINSSGGNKVHSAICNGIKNQMEAYDYETSYSRYKHLMPQQTNNEKQTNEKDKQVQKKQPVWLWLLGGFVIATILYFLFNKRNKN